MHAKGRSWWFLKIVKLAIRSNNVGETITENWDFSKHNAVIVLVYSVWHFTSAKNNIFYICNSNYEHFLDELL